VFCADDRPRINLTGRTEAVSSVLTDDVNGNHDINQSQLSIQEKEHPCLHHVTPRTGNCSETANVEELKRYIAELLHELDTFKSSKARVAGILSLVQDNVRVETPLSVTRSANERVFVSLQREVDRLREQLEVRREENSRLCELFCDGNSTLRSADISVLSCGRLSLCESSSVVRNVVQVTNQFDFCQRIIFVFYYDPACVEFVHIDIVSPYNHLQWLFTFF